MMSRLVLYEYPYNKDLDGSTAKEPKSWANPTERKTVAKPAPGAAPVDDGQTHWGWLGGEETAADAGLWPQDDAPVEMLQVASSRDAALGYESRRAREEGGGRRVWVSGSALVEMGTFAGVGVAVVVFLMEVRRRQRVAMGQDYTSV